MLLRNEIEHEDMDAKELANWKLQLAEDKHIAEETVYESVMIISHSKQARTQLQQRT